MKLVALVAVYLVVGVAQAADEFTGGATNCSESAFLFGVSVESVSSYVPEEYAMAGEESGFVTLGLTFISCETVEADGHSEENVTWSDVGVILEPVDSTPGTHFYYLWSAGDSNPLGGALKKLGVDVRQAAADHSDSGTATQGSIDNGYKFEYSGGLSGLIPLGVADSAATWWYDSGLGTARFVFNFPAVDTNFALAGNLAAHERSYIAEILGSTSAAPAVALVFRSGFTVTGSIIAP
jgi:hypothetical protein